MTHRMASAHSPNTPSSVIWFEYSELNRDCILNRWNTLKTGDAILGYHLFSRYLLQNKDKDKDNKTPQPRNENIPDLAVHPRPPINLRLLLLHPHQQTRLLRRRHIHPRLHSVPLQSRTMQPANFKPPSAGRPLHLPILLCQYQPTNRRSYLRRYQEVTDN